MKNISDMVLKCVESWKDFNDKKLPEYVIFYRDGVGSGQHEEIRKVEIESIKKKFLEKFGAKAPKLVFMLVTKRINDRFFQPNPNFDKNNQNSSNSSKNSRKYNKYQKYQNKPEQKYKNPNSGLIVDTKVTSSTLFDFFMVAQNVTQGTATPTHYQVLENETELSADFFYSLTYFQCFNYFNWSGPVKVP